MPWPMYSHDVQNTNLYGVSSLITNLVSIDGQTGPPYEINNPTPEILISGEEGMLCRWGEDNLSYSALPSDEVNQCEIDGSTAICNLSDQGEDGEKTIYISCQDYWGIDQAPYQNLIIEFTLIGEAEVEEPQISTLTTSGITTSSAVLNGNLSSLGSFLEVGVSFEWRKSGQTAWQQTTVSNKSSTGSFSRLLSGLDSNTIYQVRAVVEWLNDGLQKKVGNVRDFTTARKATSGGGGGGGSAPSEPAVVTYTISLGITPTNSGTIQGAGSYQEGTQITVSAKANDGYLFLYWQEGDKIISQNLNYTFIVEKNRTLNAVFTYVADKTEEEINVLVESIEVDSEDVSVIILDFDFSRNLTLGSIGEDVRQLQILLNSLGFLVASSGPGSPGNETAYFGSLTQQALARFQAANGISPAVGYFGPITRAFIAKMTITTSTIETPTITTPIETPAPSISRFTRDLTLGSTGEDVRQLQILLNSLGFLVASSGPGSPGNETIYFGSLTTQAVIRFQERYASEVLTPLGLSSGTGFVGRMTRDKLNQLLSN